MCVRRKILGALLCALLVTTSANAMSVEAKIIADTVAGPNVCVTHQVKVCITRADVLANPGVTSASVAIQNWDQDVFSDDFIGQVTPSYVMDLSACVATINANPSVSECCQTTSWVECWPATAVGEATGEDCVEWYIKVWVTFGTKKVRDDSPVRDVCL